MIFIKYGGSYFSQLMLVPFGDPQRKIGSAEVPRGSGFPPVTAPHRVVKDPPSYSIARL
jgi:hypothetical protein